MATRAGGPFTKVNFVLKAIFDPCDAPLTLYVETAAPALLKAIITYYTVSIIDIFTGWIRPTDAIKRARGSRKGSGGKKSGRMRKRGMLSRAAGFDPSDATGKRLPGGKELSGRVVSGGVVHLWVAFGVIERFNYWWMVISIVGDFLFDWFSVLEETIFCSARGDTVLLVKADRVGGLPVGGWGFLPLPDILKQRGNVSWSGWVGAILNASCDITLTATATNDDDHEHPAGIKIGLPSLGPGQGDVESTVTLPPHGTASLSVSTRIEGGGIFNTQSFEFSTHTALTDVYLIVNGKSPDQ